MWGKTLGLIATLQISDRNFNHQKPNKPNHLFGFNGYILKKFLVEIPATKKQR